MSTGANLFGSRAAAAGRAVDVCDEDCLADSNEVDFVWAARLLAGLIDACASVQYFWVDDRLSRLYLCG